MLESKIVQPKLSLDSLRKEVMFIEENRKEKERKKIQIKMLRMLTKSRWKSNLKLI